MEIRSRNLNNRNITIGPVIYWMSRDQRASDNWALLRAQEIALAIKQPLTVVFCLTEKYPAASPDHYRFMLEGLFKTALTLSDLNIPFIVLEGDPGEQVSGFANEIKAGAVVCDFSPLKIARAWKSKAAEKIYARLEETDTRNIVPCFIASDKQEYAAYTIRPKIKAKLDRYLTKIPSVISHPLTSESLKALSLATWNIIDVPNSGRSGEKAAGNKLTEFIDNRLQSYFKRNDPNEDVCSGLSPYLHFGQISAQRVALEIMDKGTPDQIEDFLEELIIRRELADNFCLYNQNYDSTAGFPEWGKKTLWVHRNDRREYVYDLQRFENATTHDRLWNACQTAMVKTGYMNGYLRMYWAKKILEWSRSAEDALDGAIFLNDRYELDGRDPNGYAGISWSIGGTHDRAWAERAIFGKIRYMSYEGCRRKFDTDKFISKAEQL